MSTAADTAGQAGAVRHGITRALMEFNADLRPALEESRPRHTRPASERT